MKFTNKSKILMSFLLKNKNINTNNDIDHIHHVLHKIYKDILDAHNYVLQVKKTTPHFYNTKYIQIQTTSQIPKPKNFNYNNFPLKIREHIDNTASYAITFTFSLFHKKITLIFITETSIEDKINKYYEYVNRILMWLYILTEYANKECSKQITIYFYFTTYEKILPVSNIDILDEIHVNTAFTTTCPSNSEIVIFRKEEWFKVLIHETFHNFGLDFSDINNDLCVQEIRELFQVKSHVNLYESYAETWAEIINVSFCSFIELKNKNSIDDFMYNFQEFMIYEMNYSYVQLVKVLDFMGMQYKDLCSTNSKSIIMKETLYKENTNVLAYYVIKCIIMNNYQSFLLWCNKHNLSLLQFKKTPTNLKEFCKFIRKNYKTRSMMENIKMTETFYHTSKNKLIGEKYPIVNLRMSVCEIE